MTTDKKVKEVMERADLTIAALTTNGGLLQPEQSQTFIDEVQEQPTMLSQVRVIPMNSPTYHVHKIGFAERILRAARIAGGAQDDGDNARNLRVADRSAPVTRQIELVSKEVMAEVRIPYEVVEDNIERGNFESHVMRLMAERAAQDLEEWAIRGDTGSGDAYLALVDGLVKKATTNVVDNLNAGPNPDMFRDAHLAMPQRYLRNMGSLRHFMTVQDEIRYRSNVSNRATGLGDSALQTTGSLTPYGVAIDRTPFMTPNTALLTFPQNIMFGIHRDIMVETERSIRSREFVIVLSTRVDVQYEDEEAVVKIININ